MKFFLPLTLTLLLAACGGGGSSGGGGGGQTDPAPAPAPPPPAPAPAPETFTLTGTVTASSSQSVDGDTNDPGTDFNPNDTALSAQAINNPTTLGGYVNRPGSGEPGRSFADGDVDDFFQVDLLADQVITLLVADFEQADADLYLYDGAGEIVDFSIETGELESLVVPEDGSYLVNVNAFDGATNYILAIGNQAGSASFSRQHYIEPWQAVVRYRDLEDKPAIAEAELGLERRGGGPGRARLMQLRRNMSDPNYLARRFGPAAEKRDGFKYNELQARFETLMTIKRLSAYPNVALAEPNYRVQSYLEPDDEAYSVQWHLPLIDLPAAWDSTVGEPEVTVAVVDTGILSRHPDLVEQLVAGYDFVRDPSSAIDGNGIDPNPEDPGNLNSPGPSSYHGTHVAGTVAAAGDNGIGVTGVAYGARIMPLRALGDGGGGTGYDVNQAVRYAAGLANDSGTVPERPADVINLSLGGGPFSSSTQELYNEVSARGIIVVAAAGNSATSAPQYPASYEGVLSVSATDINRQLAPYSNLGGSIDLAAPGGNNGTDFNGDGYPDGVLSTGGIGNGNPEFAYTFLAGTSMAAPHVAGVMALMRSINPDLTPGDIDDLLASGQLTDDLGIPGRDDLYGHGVINAYKAVLAALETLGSGVGEFPRLSLSANTLSFGSSGQALQLELINAGSGELVIESIDLSQPWLSVSAQQTDEQGLGLYDVSVNRAGLGDGVYAADITVRSTANAATARVFMSVGSPGGEADVGTVYILIYDPVNDEAVAQASARAENGEYPFRLSNVPAGEYEIVAGSDADNDLFICDAGEACGAWLTLDQPITLVVDGDRDGLDFPVEFQVFLPEISGATVPANKRVLMPQRPTETKYPLLQPSHFDAAPR